MSFIMTKRRITMTRGDTGRELITLKMDGEVYDMQEGDKIQFGIKAGYGDTECLIRKEYTENPFILNIEPEDTKSLDFGTYYWDMQFVSANGYVRTFADKRRLNLNEEVVRTDG